MARSIPYIDTAVSVSKTVAEIEEILQAHDASHIMKEFESGRIKSVAFKHDGVPFQLPTNVDPVYQYLLNAREQSRRYSLRYPDQAAKARLHEQAERCAWRNVMFWIKAQLALVEIGMVTVTEVFLPYMLMDGEQTLYARMLTEDLQNMLGPGSVDAKEA